MERKSLELLLVGALAGATALWNWKGRDISNYLRTQHNRNAPIEWVYESSSSDNTISKSDFEKKTLPSGHTLYVVYGSHFSQKAVEHIYKNVVPELEKNPSNWMFLVEGGLRETHYCPETRFADALSKRYSISVDDVIVLYSDLRVIDIVKSEGFSEEEIYSNMLYNNILYNEYWANRILGENNEVKSIDYAIEEIAKVTGKNESYLGKLIDKYLSSRFNNDEEREEQLHNSILNARNKISQENLATVLKSSTTPKNILLVIGRSHYAITDF